MQDCESDCNSCVANDFIYLFVYFPDSVVVSFKKTFLLSLGLVT